MADNAPIEERSDDEIAAEADPNNAANKVAIRKKQKAEDRRRARMDEVLRKLLNDPDGREWLADLLYGKCKLFTVTASADFDPHAAHFREGARAVGLLIHEQALRADLTQYMVLQVEHFGKP